ncbi:MAG: NUDIX hydrolase [Synergistaceae bacterium]|nr:NUDIX hydrolase [Synergistaceae bacterium]
MDTREKTISKNTAYRGRILNLRIDKVEIPGGKKTIREVVEHSPAVAILPVADDGSVLLIRQYRYAIGEDILEIPAGLVEPGEDFDRCAERELQEEIGYFPGTLKEIGRMYNSPGFCTEMLVLYLASNLKPSKLQADVDEFIHLNPVPPGEIASILGDGRIRDGKTFAALSWYLAFRGEI